MYLLGYDIGSSSIKAAIVDPDTGRTLAISQHPEVEMKIDAPHPDWAEQHPEDWWENVKVATKKAVEKAGVDGKEIAAIGISYQMHGLVLVDKEQKVLRPSIIWCDSRAVAIGNDAFQALGKDECLSCLLNSPGNFTSSKLRWVKNNEPYIYEQIDKIMLPGDYIAMKLTGSVQTTVSGLSEGIFWDFKTNSISTQLMEYHGFDSSLIPEVVDTFSIQGELSSHVAGLLGLKESIPVGYRAGDQPNNALSLNVLEPGEMAATGGTSGVVYGISNKPIYDNLSRINPFAHVNHQFDDPRIGVLLCVNGSGSLYSWMRQMLEDAQISYEQIEELVQKVPINSDGLQVVPFGNGAERILENQNPGASIRNLQFSSHGKAHLYRASLEGIAYAFIYGVGIMREMGMDVSVMKVGNDNLFQSAVLSETITNVLSCQIEMMETTGAVGAAKGAGVGAGIYSSLTEAFTTMKPLHVYEYSGNQDRYKEGYESWKANLENNI
ncbi:MAG: carbohydrate kinase [Ekhidna sp.]|nr:carbohydrate kinase [Ekhidna sp.]